MLVVEFLGLLCGVIWALKIILYCLSLVQACLHVVPPQVVLNDESLVLRFYQFILLLRGEILLDAKDLIKLLAFAWPIHHWGKVVAFFLWDINVFEVWQLWGWLDQHLKIMVFSTLR